MKRQELVKLLPRLWLAVLVIAAGTGCGATEEPVVTKEPVELAECEPGSPKVETSVQVEQIPWSPSVCTDDEPDPDTDPRPWYVPNHVITIGTAAAMGAVIPQTELDLGVKLWPVIDPVPLDYVDLALDAGCPSVEALFEDPPYLQDLWMQVFRICGEPYEHTFPPESALFGGIGTPVPIDVAVYLVLNSYSDHLKADLLYATGPGRPWSSEGSPWTAMGSPWTAMGSPYDGPGGPAKAFRDQWALGTDSGIGLVENGNRTTPLCGAGVSVGVFDTAPIAASQDIVLDWTSPPATLAAIYSEPNPPAAEFSPEAAVVVNHGVSVSGLIHGVAPGSRITLFRVLDERAQGDLGTLNLAIDAYVKWVVHDKEEVGNLSGAVINLSLGIHPPQDPQERALSEADPALKVLPTSILDAMKEVVPESDTVVTLKMLLAAADCHGIAVVAAAGNEAASADYHPNPEIPARYEFAIDVGAASADRVLSCFTNAGRLAAPGGQSLSDECEPEPCVDHPCMTWLTVPVASTAEPYVDGYVYWAGSSFAAPLVSGVAALIIENTAAAIAPGAWAFPGPLLDTMHEALRAGKLDDEPEKDSDIKDIHLIDVKTSVP